ncbi:hypothetical protein Gotur_031840, partial [Gossypium turneri]
RKGYLKPLRNLISNSGESKALKIKENPLLKPISNKAATSSRKLQVADFTGDVIKFTSQSKEKGLSQHFEKSDFQLW